MIERKNDGLCDGWGDGYIWDPCSGSFVQIYSSGKVYNPSGQVDDKFDLWEGEDKDRDGILDGNETDHLRPDTDCDGLWDGWDIVIDDVVHRGELYETGNTAFDSLMQISGFDYNRVYKPNTPSWEQSGSTNSSDPDTDDDGISDGEEVNGWGLRLEIRYVDPSTNIITRTVIDSIVSDPTLADRDSDGLSDWEEYSNGSLPYETDSDKDGLGDYKECSVWFTSPSDFDTDKDNLPDGWIDGWRRVNATVWKSDRTKNGQREVWEGEDINCNGSLDAMESDPRFKDTDNDYIKDGYEYFFINITRVMEPWKIVPGTGRSYWSYDMDGTSNARDNDSDEDGLLDGLEDWNMDGKLEASLSGSTYPNYVMAKESNPYDADSDDDGLKDGEDVIVGGILYNLADVDEDSVITSMDWDSDDDDIADNIDPEPLSFGDQDDDDDGLNYRLEQQLGLYIADFDNDGLLGDEDPDCDGDGLRDDFEHYTSNTDPRKNDTDGDGLDDKLEYYNMTVGLDPLDDDVDDDGLFDGNPFEGVRDFSLNVKSKNQWSNSDSDFETILEEPFTYNFNDDDSDGDGLKDGYELGAKDKDGNLIGDINKSRIEGDTDNDRTNDYGETWLNLNPMDADTDDDNVPDGWIDGWTVDRYGNWGLNKALRNGDKDYIEGEGIDYDGTEIYIKQREINAKLATYKDSDGDSLPDSLDRRLRTDATKNDTDGDGTIDTLDLEPLLPQTTYFGFVIKSFFVMDDDWDNDLFQGDDRADVYFTLDVKSRGSFIDKWKDENNGGASIGKSKYPNYKGIMNDHHESYGSDHIRDMNEQYVVKNLPRNHYQILFTLRMYDDDTSKEDELIDISPTDTYTLEVFYDVVTGMWALWKDMDKVKGTYYEETYLENSTNLLEGIYSYKNQNNSFTVINETNKGKPVAGVKDGIGYVTGYEKKGDDLGEAGGIQFEIVPYDRNNRTVGLEYFDFYQDFDYDGLTSMSELFWSNNTIYCNGSKLNYKNLSTSVWDSDGDKLSDGWEVKYGFNPCNNSSPGSVDDGDNDGIIDLNEFYLEANPDEKTLMREWVVNGTLFKVDIKCRIHNMSVWGAQPDRQDIFVEVDWMNDTTGKEYKMSNGTIEKLIFTFFKACKYGENITLHIDDGCMGGGGDILPWNKTISWTSDYYNNFFSKERKNSNWRHCAMVYDSVGKHTNGVGFKGETNSVGGDHFLLYNKNILAMSKPTKWQASIFMHELGHTLGLNADFLKLNNKTNPDPIPPSKYPSCMRYGRDNDDPGFIDYSSVVDTISVWHTEKKYWIDLDTNDWGKIKL